MINLLVLFGCTGLSQKHFCLVPTSTGIHFMWLFKVTFCSLRVFMISAGAERNILLWQASIMKQKQYVPFSNR